ncbi:DUF3861 domain-containing protein [Shewanella algae]|uniref:DUF3861 domain-containing protein n=1 Tax=Shewanella algae TaxID=38313 RepID=UPI001AAD921E|nr:DUF3861 domain-containing protein [Shewanella algae]MBO2619616.1 DUF3861 domain-containing protein [Shewanella algae]MDO8254277.1 DUF3861 domain-containing protein [Shewanella algae]QTE96220.1 DUF3861 domain-containing protein [Shewanella algae]
MKQHKYSISVEHLEDQNGMPSNYQQALKFEVGNHDDIFAIVDKIKQRQDFDEDQAAAFAVGLKLFSEVMLKQRKNPLFDEFRPHFMQFMKQLKQGNRSA